MLSSALHALAATPTPLPTEGPDPSLVTPGVEGFVVIALLVVVVGLLVADMLRRVRNTRYRAEANEALDAEEAESGRPAGDKDDSKRGDDTVE
ncbi:hypothetical protein ACOKGD_09925 [Microbacterium phosphatis]|uniref:hypothetical protein n=1 Tax=Microbacterium phosphatis TaxID=3140248 RepID=UPI0031403421